MFGGNTLKPRIISLIISTLKAFDKLSSILPGIGSAARKFIMQFLSLNEMGLTDQEKAEFAHKYDENNKRFFIYVAYRALAKIIIDALNQNKFLQNTLKKLFALLKAIQDHIKYQLSLRNLQIAALWEELDSRLEARMLQLVQQLNDQHIALERKKQEEYSKNKVAKTRGALVISFEENYRAQQKNKLKNDAKPFTYKGSRFTTL